jgi:hypothetical protein
VDILDMGGTFLGPMEVINLYNKARKLAPPRFLIMRVNPITWSHIEDQAIPTHVIQYGDTPGPMGRTVLRLACVKPAPAIADGIAVVKDTNTEVGDVVFEIHGVPEIVMKGYSLAAKS